MADRIRSDAFNEIAALLERAELGLDRMGEEALSAQLYEVIIAIDKKRVVELPAPCIGELKLIKCLHVCRWDGGMWRIVWLAPTTQRVPISRNYRYSATA